MGGIHELQRFAKKHSLDGLTPTEVWDVETVLFGALMASFPLDKSKYGLAKYLKLLGDMVELCDTLADSICVQKRFGEEAINAYMWITSVKAGSGANANARAERGRLSDGGQFPIRHGIGTGGTVPLPTCLIVGRQEEEAVMAHYTAFVVIALAHGAFFKVPRAVAEGTEEDYDQNKATDSGGCDNQDSSGSDCPYKED